MKISEDIKPISYVKSHSNEVIEQINDTGRPVIITQNGEPTAILQDVNSYEKEKEKWALLKIVNSGIMEIQKGNVIPHKKVIEKARQKIKN